MSVLYCDAASLSIELTSNAQKKLLAVDYNRLFAYTCKELFEIVYRQYHRRSVVARVKFDVLRIPHVDVDKQRCRIRRTFVEIGKRRNTAAMYGKVGEQFFFCRELELGATHVACQTAHICALVEREHYHIIVVAFFVLDVQTFARHAVVYVHHVFRFVGGNNRLVTYKSVTYAQGVQITCHFCYHTVIVVLCDGFDKRDLQLFGIKIQHHSAEYFVADLLFVLLGGKVCGVLGIAQKAAFHYHRGTVHLSAHIVIPGKGFARNSDEVVEYLLHTVGKNFTVLFALLVENLRTAARRLRKSVHMHAYYKVGIGLLDYLFAGLHIPRLEALGGQTVQPVFRRARVHNVESAVFKYFSQSQGVLQIERRFLFAVYAHNAAVDTAVTCVYYDGVIYQRSGLAVELLRA